MFDVKLALLMLAGTTALIEALKPCCYSKKMMGRTFTLMESNSKEVAAYGCDTANDCVYKEDGTSDRYCFKMGGQEEPVCLQELPTCTKYFAMPTLEGPADRRKIDTLFYTLADNGTCTLPTFPKYPTDSQFHKGKLLVSDGDLMVFDADELSGNRMKQVIQFDDKNRQWEIREFDKVDDSFPRSGYAIIPWKKELYLIGGSTFDFTGMYAGVFKSADGKKWVKLPWELKFPQSELKACITTNADSGHANLVVFGGVSQTEAVKKEIKIYDIEDPNPATDGYMAKTVHELKGDAGLKTHQLVCHDGWVYIAEFNPKLLHSVKLSSSAEFKAVEYNQVYDGTLMVYQNKAGFAASVKGAGKFFYFDTTSESLKEGSEFPWFKEAGHLVPVVTM